MTFLFFFDCQQPHINYFRKNLRLSCKIFPALTQGPLELSPSESMQISQPFGVRSKIFSMCSPHLLFLLTLHQKMKCVFRKTWNSRCFGRHMAKASGDPLVVSFRSTHWKAIRRTHVHVFTSFLFHILEAKALLPAKCQHM